MIARRILLVEDDPGLSMTVGDRLRAEGFEIETAEDGEQGLQSASNECLHDLIVLDVMLPRLDGFEVCRRLRQQGVRTPILMLTARGEVSDRVTGLRLGADDYLTKPFDPDELVARIDALIRRAHPSKTEPAPMDEQVFGDAKVDRRGMSVTRGGEAIELTAMEYQLLIYLIDHEGSVVSREQILRDVWGFQRIPRTRTVDVHITWLRQKLEPNRSHPRFIQTVRGAGYKFSR